MSREMLDMVDVLANEKNVEKSAVFGVLEIALASAVKKAQFPGEDAEVVVRVDPNTGDWTAVRRWVVVSDEAGLQQPDREEMFSDIHDDYPELEVGDFIEKPIENINTSGRRFAQDAKQVILQRLRDAEREQILNEFLARQEDVVSGQVKRTDKEGAVIEIGRLEARLPKIAVMSRDKRVEPVCTCIGIRGSRVTAVTNELAGERIDVVRWDENPVQYIVEALKPAKVSKVVADEEARSMDVTVDEENLAIAIGRGGQNVRLASELTGWQINIMTAEEANKKQEEEDRAACEEFMTELGMSQEDAMALVQDGIYSLEELAYVPEQEIVELGIFDEATVADLRDRSRRVLLARALKREENLRQADASLVSLEGMDNDLASRLVSEGVKTADDLGDLDTDELVAKTGLSQEDAQRLIMAARATWTEQ